MLLYSLPMYGTKCVVGGAPETAAIWANGNVTINCKVSELNYVKIWLLAQESLQVKTHKHKAMPVTGRVGL
jgi:hypothetical protein